jgi:hypothetical protein
MNRKIIYLIILSFCCIQCKDNGDKTVPFTDVPGKYVHLEKDNIYLFVPENVKMFSHDDHLAFVNSIENEQVREMERARYLNLKYGTESSYMLRSEGEDELEITLVPIPYIPIDKSISQEILKFLNRNHKKTGEILGLESSFSRAGIIKIGNDRIFRAIFLYKGMDILTGEDVQIYTYFYLANRKGKTFMLSFNSKEAKDFDSYVQKIRL